jgi:hypothetical protein
MLIAARTNRVYYSPFLFVGAERPPYCTGRVFLLASGVTEEGEHLVPNPLRGRFAAGLEAVRT